MKGCKMRDISCKLKGFKMRKSSCCYIHIVSWEENIGKKEFWRLKQEANKVSVIDALNLIIFSFGDLRINHFKERENDMIHARVEQSNANFGVIFYIV